MKKLFLSAAVVMAVVGSALAFSNPTDILFVDDPDVQGVDCSLQIQASTNPLAGTFLFNKKYGFEASATECPEEAANLYSSN